VFAQIASMRSPAAEPAALPASVALRICDADEALLHVPVSFKVNGEGAFLRELFEAGRAAVAR
jgi:hypothetical protein